MHRRCEWGICDALLFGDEVDENGCHDIAIILRLNDYGACLMVILFMEGADVLMINANPIKERRGAK